MRFASHGQVRGGCSYVGVGVGCGARTLMYTCMHVYVCVHVVYTPIYCPMFLDTRTIKSPHSAVDVVLMLICMTS